MHLSAEPSVPNPGVEAPRSRGASPAQADVPNQGGGLQELAGGISALSQVHQTRAGAPRSEGGASQH